ncbi:MAG: septum formation initiator family protein [Gammaproteobacteria bacterium]|nr:septum formation initiator family protein [Gammaproteobacteria bacterium]
MKPRTAGILLACLALAGLQYPLWFADDGLLGILRARQELAEQEKENEALRERNRRLVAEVQSLKEGDEEIERLARSELGMIGPDEKIYLLVEEAAESEDPEQARPSGGPRE